jgi:hypothetical protein
MTAPRQTTLADDRLRDVHAAYVHKVNSLVATGDDDLALELAHAFSEEADGSARSLRAERPGRVSSFARNSLARFDRYTLDVFNAGTPTRPGARRTR